MNRFWLCAVVAAVMGAAVAQPVAAQEREARQQRVRAVEAAPAQGWLGLVLNYTRTGSGRRTEEHAVITAVHPGSPAARAGLQVGDSLVRFNGRTDVEAQVRALRLQPGDTVRVRVRRQGQRDRDVVLAADRRPTTVAFRPGPGGRFEVRRPGVVIIDGDTVRIPLDSLALEAADLQRRIRVLIADSLGPRLREFEEVRMPQLREQLRRADSAWVHAFPDGLVFEVGRRAVAGAEFSELSPELADYFEGAREGLLVLRVAAESPAARAGLQPGDVVVRANGDPVRTTADLRRSVARAGRDEVRLGVVRRGRPLELRLR
jgi:S1-C subfamily serine protease